MLWNRKFRVLASLLYLASACESGESVSDQAAYVLVQTSIDPRSGAGEFALKARVLPGITDFDGLSGDWFGVLRGGTLHVDLLSGSVVVGGRYTGGAPPRLRYAVEDGTARALDYNTLIMLSAAHAFGTVFERLDASVGVSVEVLNTALGQMQVLFEPSISISGDAEAVFTPKANAFFDQQQGLFGLARRSEAEGAPLVADIKVIAHEVGHAVFFVTFGEQVRETCERTQAGQNASDPWFPGRFDYEYAIRGLNEGFADLVSFAVTGSPDPIANLPGRSERHLQQDDFRWSDLVANDVDGSGPDDDEEPPCLGEHYCIGTLFGRATLAAYDATESPVAAAQRHQMMREVTAALEAARKVMRRRGRLPLPRAGTAECEPEEFDAVEDGRVLGSALEGIVAALPQERRAHFCRELDARLGKQGFPQENREDCP